VLTKVLAISVAYVAMGVLLLLMVIKPSVRWRWKALAILVSTFLFVDVFFETRSLLGWPGVGRLPDRFQLLWVRVVEPDVRLSDPGAIYMWVEEVDENNVPIGVPRSYRVPYKRALAEQSVKARDQIMQGNPQEGTAESMAGEEKQQDQRDSQNQADRTKALEGAPLEAASGTQRLDLDALQQGQQTIEFRPMPTTLLPVKRGR
jgi:hypothetical protein